MEQAWDFASAAPSWNPTVAASGLVINPRQAQFFLSRCLLKAKRLNKPAASVRRSNVVVHDRICTPIPKHNGAIVDDLLGFNHGHAKEDETRGDCR